MSNVKQIDSNSKYKTDFSVYKERFFVSEIEFTDYSNTRTFDKNGFNLLAEYSTKKNSLTPLSLKKAMFRTSSRGIAKALNK
jgi:hypothetical protein